jgi:hypothetical protein
LYGKGFRFSYCFLPQTVIIGRVRHGCPIKKSSQCGDQEFQPDNLIYSYDDKVSISGWFQRLDNFLDKGLEQTFQTYNGNIEREIEELATVDLYGHALSSFSGGRYTSAAAESSCHFS